MEITFAEVKIFRLPQRKWEFLAIFATQGSGDEALQKIHDHVVSLRINPLETVRAFRYQPTEAELEHAEAIVPRIKPDSAIEIIV